METHFLPLRPHSCIFHICQCSRGHGSLLYVADRNYLFYLSCVLFRYQYDPGHELILPLIIVMLSSNSDCYRYIQYAAQQAVKAAERLNLQS